jgi:hypothetical protein
MVYDLTFAKAPAAQSGFTAGVPDAWLEQILIRLTPARPGIERSPPVLDEPFWQNRLGAGESFGSYVGATLRFLMGRGLILDLMGLRQPVLVHRVIGAVSNIPVICSAHGSLTTLPTDLPAFAPTSCVTGHFP